MADSTEPSAAPPPTEAAPALTPLNITLLALFFYIVYLKLRPAAPLSIPAPPKPAVFRVFTPKALLPFNGENGQPVYLAVRSHFAPASPGGGPDMAQPPRLSGHVHVFDVSAGRNFYGPGGPYQNFAGRDASRGLACGSFDENMLTENLNGPLDSLSDLGPEEMEALRGWEERFSEKYLIVGKLVAEGSEEAEEAKRA